MASAEKVVEVVEETTCVLTLTAEEAQVLTELLGWHVGGKATVKWFNGIFEALEGSGFCDRVNFLTHLDRTSSSIIYLDVRGDG